MNTFLFIYSKHRRCDITPILIYRAAVVLHKLSVTYTFTEFKTNLSFDRIIFFFNKNDH